MKEWLFVMHQPDFLPYLGFFHRLMLADAYVVLDIVKISDRSRNWTNRDKIKTRNGEKWLTVGTVKYPRGTPINQIRLNSTDWRNDNLNLIKANYLKARYFNEIYPNIQELYNYECEYLYEFNMRSIMMLNELFGIQVEILYAHDLDVVGSKNELNVDILKKLDAKEYLSGIGARDFHNQQLFDEAGINVIWQDFKHPVYPQQFGEFIPYLSSIDMLFNCGIEESRRIMRELL